MDKQLVFVNEGQVEVLNVDKEDFNSSEHAIPRHRYAKEVACLEAVCAELVKLTEPEYAAKHGAEFLRQHAVWLHNLVKTGFAIEYTQYVKDS